MESNGADYVERANWDLVTELLAGSALSELLISIAIAAERVGAWTIVQAIAHQGMLFAERGLTKPAAIGRVFRCEVDTHILRCGAPGAIQTLSGVRSRIAALIDQCSPALDSWKARVKLTMRLGEVNYLIGEFALAQENFADAEKMAYEASNTEHLSLMMWERSPILGHGARRYLRLLCDIIHIEENVFSRAELLEKADDLYTTNIRRIARFPSERQLSLLDQAMIAKCRSQFEQCYNLLQKASPLTSTGIMSLSARIDFEYVLGKIAVELLDAIGNEYAERRFWLATRAKAAIDAVLRLARTSEFPLFQAFGEILAARWLELSPSDSRGHGGSVFDDRKASDLIRTASSTLRYVECGLFSRFVS